MKNRNDIGKNAGIIGIIANLLLAGGKLTVGILSMSMSIIADAINNFSDSISSVVTLIGFKLAKNLPTQTTLSGTHALNILLVL